MAKINLVLDELPGPPNKLFKSKSVKRCLPFFKSYRVRSFAHRIRSANHHFYGGQYLHTSLNFWCGGGGFTHKGDLMGSTHENQIFCATCEARAIAFGLEGRKQINNKKVGYNPKIK